MRKIVASVSFAVIILGLGCTKHNEVIKQENNHNLVGYWSNPVMADTLWQFERVNELKNNEYTVEFKDDFTLTERKNAGWCGTPPISYGNFTGTWKLNNGNVKFSVGYWGGTVDCEWKIISITNKYLTVYKVKEDYRWENKD